MAKKKTWITWIKEHKAFSGIGGAVLVTVVGTIGWFVPKGNDHVEIQQNANRGQTAYINNRDGKVSVTQTQGVDPNEYGATVKALGKTEHELEQAKSEKQQLAGIVEAYKRDDKEKRAALEKADNVEKTTLIVKILHANDQGTISKEDALRLCDMVNKSTWDDLKAFLENKNLTIDSHSQSLVLSGIFEAQVVGDRLRARYNPPQIRYVLTSDGGRLLDIGNSSK
jgi:hypothetical protein